MINKTCVSNTDPIIVNGNFEYENDVAVLLIFFNRPSTFKKVFEQIKLARPSKLFLYQDGARNSNDLEGVNKCREIAEDIDWKCEVYKFYQTDNVGCDPSEYISQKWAFSIVDKCIVLEDDDVPSQSFFPFCKELLDRYENDERINIICGMNNLESYENIDTDYFFSYTGSIWGWASWRRVIEQWTDTYPMLNNPFMLEKFKSANTGKHLIDNYIKTALRHQESGRAHYESILSYNMFTQNTINIVPKYNMILNVGQTAEGGTHSSSDLKFIPKGLRKIFTMKSYEIDFPLKHPDYVMEDVEYRKRLFRVMGWGHPFVKLYRRFESIFLVLIYGDRKEINKKIKKLFHLK